MDGLFALGVAPDRYRLPHPRLGLPVVLLIRRVILRAFEILRQRHDSLAAYEEDQITTALRAVIENDLRQAGSVPGFSHRTFEPVLRQSQVVNHDLTSLAKTPDLCFKPRNDEEEPAPVLAEHDALFVECKRVDRSNAAGGQYCDQGLCRFVDGDYAWAMEEGMMLGYARHGRTIAKHLLPAIRDGRLERLKVVETPHPVEQDDVGNRDVEALHVSRHRRDFAWSNGKGPATEILVYHSWHSCD